MSTLVVAIERRQWELVSLCLLVAVAEAAAALPPDAVEALLEVLVGLEGEDVWPRGGARPFGRLPGRAGRTGSFDRLRTGRGRRC